MNLYRQGELNLDQLTAFAITDDHAAQERVWSALPGCARRGAILRALTEGQVPTDDRRFVYVGAEAYEQAGGAIMRWRRKRSSTSMTRHAFAPQCAAQP
jgi:ParB family chromosome partitioning protein